MSTHYFCTLFDSNYLIKGTAMLQSLKRNCQNAYVYVLCMDEETHRILTSLNLPFVGLIPLYEIEDQDLLAVKGTRGVAEYCWTLSPCLPWYVLNRHPQVNFVTYLDADLLFYSDVQPIFDEIDSSSIAIIEHRFTERLKDREVNGRFCVEWVSFRRDEEGLACLSRWREQCIEWCYYRLEDGKMGDQKYLDEWPSRYHSCHIINNLGAGVAPWNYAQYFFGKDGDGFLTVQNSPLIFYHFHQFQLMENGKFDRLSGFYTSECAEPAEVYEAYENELDRCLLGIQSIDPSFKGGLMPVKNVQLRRFSQKYVPSVIKNWIRKYARF